MEKTHASLAHTIERAILGALFLAMLSMGYFEAHAEEFQQTKTTCCATCCAAHIKLNNTTGYAYITLNGNPIGTVQVKSQTTNTNNTSSYTTSNPGYTPQQTAPQPTTMTDQYQSNNYQNLYQSPTSNTSWDSFYTGMYTTPKNTDNTAKTSNNQYPSMSNNVTNLVTVQTSNPVYEGIYPVQYSHDLGN